MFTQPDFTGYMKVIYHKNFGCINIPKLLVGNVSSMKMYGYCLTIYEERDCTSPLRTYKEMEVMSLGKYQNRVKSIFTFECMDLAAHVEQWRKSVIRRRQKMNNKIRVENARKKLIDRFHKLQKGSSAYDFIESSLNTQPLYVRDKHFKNSIDQMREKWKLRMYKKLQQKLKMTKTTKRPSSF